MKFLKEFQNFISLIFKKIPLPKGIPWIVILLFIYLIYRLLTRAIEKALLKALHGDVHKVKAPIRAWRIFFWSIALILFLAGAGGNLATLGLSAAFIGMILGWSLTASCNWYRSMVFDYTYEAIQDWRPRYNRWYNRGCKTYRDNVYYNGTGWWNGWG